jgi:amidohydrolase
MENKLLKHIKEEISSIIPKIKKIRQELHEIPEIALEEYQTSEKIRYIIQETSLKLWDPLIETDVIAELNVSGASDTLCYRADIDALPIQEDTGIAYCSKNKGFMHACGHDGHAAILIGMALILDKLKKLLPCNIRFVFQPGEEVQAVGAKLVERGALKGVDEVYALHGFPGTPVGNIYSRSGILLAAAHMFTINILGRGGHGATPHLAKNPIPVAAKITLMLKELHQNIQQEENSVITICSLLAGNTATVIPDEAVIQGTARFFKKEVGTKIEKKIKQIVSETCMKESIEFKINYDKRYHLPVINAKLPFRHLKNTVSKYISEKQFKVIEFPLMWAEDFAFYLDRKPGCMFLLGLGEKSSPLHSSKFDFNDEAIFYGILSFCLLALDRPNTSK